MFQPWIAQNSTSSHAGLKSLIHPHLATIPHIFTKGVDRGSVSIYRNIMKKEIAIVINKESNLWWWRDKNGASGGLP
jgi:hypothetical protein